MSFRDEIYQARKKKQSGTSFREEIYAARKASGKSSDNIHNTEYVLLPRVAPAPKTAAEKEADINRREANRSVAYKNTLVKQAMPEKAVDLKDVRMEFHPAPQKNWFEKTIENIWEGIKNSDIVQQPLRNTNNQSWENFTKETGWTSDDITEQAIRKSTDGDAPSVHPNYMQKAIENGAYKNDEKLSEVKEGIESIKKSWEYSPLSATAANIGAAGADMGANIAGALQMLGGDKIPGVNDVLDAAVNAAKKAQEDAQSYNKATGDEMRGAYTQMITQMIPYVILAFATGGTSSGASLASVGMSATQKAMMTLMKNPTFWYSFINGAGEKYRSAIDKGATRGQATTNALYAIPEAIVEIGGGFGADDVIEKNLANTIGEEIVEEITQNTIGNVGEKFSYDYDKPWFSTKENAVINPKEMADTAVMTALLTGTMGATTKGINTAINKKSSTANSGGNVIQYTEEEADGIRKDSQTFRNVIADTDITLGEFFNKWKLGRKKGEKLEKLYLGKASESVKKQIEALLGYDIPNRDFILTNDGVKHVFDYHGDQESEAKRGQVAVDENTIGDLLETINSPDEITKENRKGTDRLIFTKHTGNGDVTVVEIDNKGRATLAVKTMYIKKSTGNTSAKVPVVKTTAPSRTSETTEPNPIDNTTIPHESGNVKTAETTETGAREDAARMQNAEGRVQNELSPSPSTNEQFEQEETSETLSPQEAQKYNIVVSNLKRKAEELGLLDNNFFTALQNVNLYNPTASDRALISSEFRRVFAGNTDQLITNWLDAIGTDTQLAGTSGQTAGSEVQGAGNGGNVAVLEKAPEREYNGDNTERSALDGQGEAFGEENQRGDRTSSAQIYGRTGREEVDGGTIPQDVDSSKSLDIHSNRRLGKDSRWEPKDYTEPEVGSVAEKTQKALAEYGIQSYVISSESWRNKYNSKKDAYTHKGQVYLRDDLKPVLKTESGYIEIDIDAFAKSHAAHEGSHVMRQSRNPQYIEFLKKFSGMLNVENFELIEALGNVAEEHGVDTSIFGKIKDIDSLSEKETDKVLRAYDELNARIYGTVLLDETLAEGFFSQFFTDNTTYREYLSEMDKLHDDYKALNKGAAQQNNNEEATDAEDAFAVSSAVSGEKESSGKTENKKAKDGMKVSKVRSNTIQRSGIFSEEELQNPELQEEKFKYKPIGEDETQRRARERIAEGRDEAREHIENKEAWDGTDTDTAFELLRMERADAAESGDWMRVGELARLIQKRATKAGQEIQAHAKYTRTAEKTIVEAAEQIENSPLVSKEDIELLRKFIKRFVNDRGELDTVRMDKALTEFLKEEPKARKKRVRKVFRELIKSKKEDMGKMEFLMETEKILSSHMEDTVKAQEIMKTVSGAADLIYSIKEDGKASKDKLIELIKKQATIRGHKISQANEKRLLGEDFEFLYETAEKQLRAITEDYIPRSLGQKVSTIQSLGQLLQLPTYLTNIISNRAFGFADKQTANIFGQAFDRIISLATKQKTIGYEHTFKHGIKEAGEKAKNRAKLNASLDIKSGEAGRYGTGTTRTFKSDESRGGVTKFLSNVEKLLAYELNVPDEAQKGRIKRSVTESLIPLVESGNMTVEEATEIAADEARYRTFQDDNLPSKILGELKKVANFIGTKDFGLGDFICKYTQVAGALIERTLEYSPGGYVKGIYNLGEMMKNGISAKKQREAAMAFARGTTGTGLIALGALLSSLKIIFRDDDEKNDDIRALNSAEGVVGTKINISAMGRLLGGKSTDPKKGDTILSVDRFEPFNMFFTVGAEIAKAENKSFGNIALTSIAGAIKSIRDLSIMQTIDDISTTLEYNDDSDQIKLASDFAILIGESAVSSFIPSAVRRSARALDNNYRDAYADNSEIGIAARQIGSSIPGIRQALPKKLDNFGNEKTYTDNGVYNALNALVLPFEVSQYKKSDVSRELERVRKETGNTSIYPPKSAPYSIKYDGEKYVLHAEARERYQKTRGNTMYRLIFEALKNERYKKLNADQQASILEDFKKYATDKAKDEYFKSVRVQYERDATAYDADEERLEGVKISDYYIDKYAEDEEKKAKSEAREKARRTTIEKRFGKMSDERYSQVKRAISKADNKNDAVKRLEKLGYKNSIARRIYTLYHDAE